MIETVAELITAVRNQVDELNEASITDDYILEELNRAQKALVRMMAKNEDSMLLEVYTTLLNSGTVGVDGTREYDMPPKVAARRIEKVELRAPNAASVWQLKPITFKSRDSVRYDNGGTRPGFYDIRRNKIRVYPQSTANYEMIVFFTQEPEPLVKPLGRINSINTTNNYIIVDKLGSDISTESDQRESYVNIIDFETGEIKASLQVAFIDTALKQVKFKASGLNRTKVFQQTIGTEIPSNVVEDDLICFVRGTCVPQYPGLYTDFLVQKALVSVKHKLREDTQEVFAALRIIEKDLQQMALGRDPSFRVKQTSKIWASQRLTLRRY